MCSAPRVIKTFFLLFSKISVYYYCFNCTELRVLTVCFPFLFARNIKRMKSRQSRLLNLSTKTLKMNETDVRQCGRSIAIKLQKPSVLNPNVTTRKRVQHEPSLQPVLRYMVPLVSFTYSTLSYVAALEFFIAIGSDILVAARR